MVKAIPSSFDVYPNQEHLVCVLEEKRRRDGARSVKLWALFNPLPISIPSDPLGHPCSSFYPDRDPKNSLQLSLR